MYLYTLPFKFGVSYPVMNDTEHVMNVKEVLCMFMTAVIKCHSLNSENFNTNMTLFETSLWT